MFYAILIVDHDGRVTPCVWAPTRSKRKPKPPKIHRSQKLFKHTNFEELLVDILIFCKKNNLPFSSLLAELVDQDWSEARWEEDYYPERPEL